MGGSEVIESTTDGLIEAARKTIMEIESMGGAMECVKAGLQQKIIHESAWEQINRVEAGEELVVGVNSHAEEIAPEFEGLVINPEDEKNKVKDLIKLKKSREGTQVEHALEEVREACINGTNVMEPIISAVKLEATVGEINNIMREVFGKWVAPSGV